MIILTLKQFVINSLISISIIGVDLSITNSSLTMIIAIVLIITAYKLSIERGYIVSTRLQSVVEILYETVYGLIKDNIREKGNAYFPFIFTLFTYIVVLNLMGMVPYVFRFTALSFGITLWVLSLDVRLAANISAGHFLLAILSGFTWTMLVAGYLLSLAVIQAYVFTLLTCIYINSISLLLTVSTCVTVFFFFFAP